MRFSGDSGYYLIDCFKGYFGRRVSDLTFYLVVYLLCAVIPMLIRTCIKHNHYKADKKEKNAILAIMFVVIAILVCAGTLILI